MCLGYGKEPRTLIETIVVSIIVWGSNRYLRQFEIGLCNLYWVLKVGTRGLLPPFSLIQFLVLGAHSQFSISVVRAISVSPVQTVFLVIHFRVSRGEYTSPLFLGFMWII